MIIRILVLFPILILLAISELIEALGTFAHEVGKIWQDEDWQSQVASIVIWIVAACGVWWLM